MGKNKILHFVPGFDHGGIESRLLDWYKEIDRESYQFDLLKTTENNENILLDEFEKLGGEVFTIPKFSPKNYRNFILKLNNMFINNDYKAVHCHSPSTGYFVLNAAKKFNVPVRIMHARTNKFDNSSSFLIYREHLKRKTVKSANVYLACSQSAGEWMYGEDKRFEVIKNGINIEKFKYDSEMREKIRKELNIKSEKLLGYISRLSASKNHLLLLDILREMIDMGEDVKLVLIGEGPQKIEIKKKIEALEIEPYVLLLGLKHNVSDYYNAMDFFLFPSEYEGFGTVAIEAQASGLKTIISSGVPRDVEITNLTKRISLTSEVSEWIDAIDTNTEYARCDFTKEITNAGFDVKESVKRLEVIYSGKTDY